MKSYDELKAEMEAIQQQMAEAKLLTSATLYRLQSKWRWIWIYSKTDFKHKNLRAAFSAIH